MQQKPILPKAKIKRLLAANCFRPTRCHTLKSNPHFRCESKTEEELNLVVLNDTPMYNHTKGELSRPFH